MKKKKKYHTVRNMVRKDPEITETEKCGLNALGRHEI